MMQLTLIMPEEADLTHFFIRNKDTFDRFIIL